MLEIGSQLKGWAKPMEETSVRLEEPWAIWLQEPDWADKNQLDFFLEAGNPLYDQVRFILEEWRVPEVHIVEYKVELINGDVDYGRFVFVGTDEEMMTCLDQGSKRKEELLKLWPNARDLSWCSCVSYDTPWPGCSCIREVSGMDSGEPTVRELSRDEWLERFSPEELFTD
jgi:hypothetical protein